MPGAVCLAADTRSTSGTVVADKNCEKIHYLAPNIYCCGAGTARPRRPDRFKKRTRAETACRAQAADTEKTTELIASQLELLRLSTGTQSRVVAAVTLLKRMLFKYQGHIGAALVLGGVDCTGPGLYQIYPHGSTSKLPYVTMGSGSLAAMSVFETEYKDGMDEAGAVALVKNAIRAGIFNDLGSGSNVDVTIIRAGGASEAIRGYETPNDTAPLRGAYARPKALIPPAAATAVLSTVVSVSDADAMEL